MKDLFEHLYEDVMAQAKKNNVSIAKTMETFLHAYDKHKAQHGSFRDHPEYTDAMKGRYRYMHDKAIKYINTEVQKRGE